LYSVTKAPAQRGTKICPF